MRSDAYPQIGRPIKLLQQTTLKEQNARGCGATKRPTLQAPRVDEQNLIPRPAQRQAKGA
jgi:hypothetical protein